MNFFKLLFASLLLAAPCLADDTAVAAQMKALGAQVTEDKGAITRLVFRSCAKLGDAEFKAIGQIKTLKVLTLYGGCKGLNDETIGHLAGLTNLEELGTDGIMVSDAGLAKFASLKSLKSLSFFHPSFRKEGFTGSGLAALKDVPALRKLTWAGSSAGDAALEAIGQLTQLQDFSTWHTYQTEAGNAHLLKLTNLKSVRLGQRLPQSGPEAKNAHSLTDATLAMLLEMKGLESVSLDEARLSLDALTSLKALPNLKTLKIGKVDLAAGDLEKIKEALPGVKVDWKPLTIEERTALEKYLKTKAP